jgi:hypothetical protein
VCQLGVRQVKKVGWHIYFGRNLTVDGNLGGDYPPQPGMLLARRPCPLVLFANAGKFSRSACRYAPHSSKHGRNLDEALT